jgi:hypothetical protein
MARNVEIKRFVTVNDDLDGTELPEDTPDTVLILNGKKVSLVLSEQNVKALEELLAPYFDNGTVTTASARPATAKAKGDDDPIAIREWAKKNVELLAQNSLTVPGDRGRLSQDVVNLWKLHNPTEEEASASAENVEPVTETVDVETEPVKAKGKK